MGNTMDTNSAMGCTICTMVCGWKLTIFIEQVLEGFMFLTHNARGYLFNFVINRESAMKFDASELP